MNGYKTKKGIYNAIVRKAEKINEKLRKLQEEAERLIYFCNEFQYIDEETYIITLVHLAETAEDLKNFDFEDSIPEKADYNF